MMPSLTHIFPSEALEKNLKKQDLLMNKALPLCTTFLICGAHVEMLFFEPKIHIFKISW